MRRYNSFTNRWRFFGLLSVVPAAVIIVCLILYPLLLNIGYCFTDFDGINTNVRFIGLLNFQSIFGDPNFRLVLMNTFKLAVIYVVALNTLAILFAVLISKVGRFFGNLVKSVLYFPCLLSAVIVGFVWRLIYDSRKGLLNGVFRALGLDVLAQNWLGDLQLVLPSVSVAIIWFALGYYTVIYYAGLMSIPVELYEASDVEGAGGWQTFRHITLPLLSQSITINVVLSTMAILSTFDLPFTLTAGGGPGYYGTTISMMIYSTAYEYMQSGKAFAMASLLTLIAMTIAFLELRVLLKREVH